MFVIYWTLDIGNPILVPKRKLANKLNLINTRKIALTSVQLKWFKNWVYNGNRFGVIYKKKIVEYPNLNKYHLLYSLVRKSCPNTTTGHIPMNWQWISYSYFTIAISASQTILKHFSSRIFCLRILINLEWKYKFICAHWNGRKLIRLLALESDLIMQKYFSSVCLWIRPFYFNIKKCKNLNSVWYFH